MHNVKTIIFNITNSFVWPAYFHLRLHGSGLNVLGRSRNYSIMALGIIFGTVCLYYRQVLEQCTFEITILCSTQALLAEMNYEDEYV